MPVFSWIFKTSIKLLRIIIKNTYFKIFQVWWILFLIQEFKAFYVNILTEWNDERFILPSTRHHHITFNQINGNCGNRITYHCFHSASLWRSGTLACIPSPAHLNLLKRSSVCNLIIKTFKHIILNNSDTCVIQVCISQIRFFKSEFIIIIILRLLRLFFFCAFFNLLFL